ncbi:endoribonuclease L-PSP [Calycina marina]|uniref:Endoribonuclease L-PSP n=1 Tax=Calycina marina TaxID=1763456 RepID=A0A9P7Z4V9_9HELO|nr:endoribonuclease L-PSP [Calycina marina]
MHALRRLSRQLSRPLYSNVSKQYYKSHTSGPRPSDMIPILSQKAMPPVGPYSQAIKTPHAIYCSGQLPADSKGKPVEGSMREKTKACLQALSAVLEEAGSSLDRVVKVQIFLTDMKDFAEMNAEYETCIKHRPARSCVAVKELPKGVNVEIEVIALPGLT